jgi:hypothetical protein
MISAVDYESHFDNKFSVDKFSILANERFETSLDLEKYFSGDTKSRIKKKL